ncbi:MAG TPA: ATP-binding protein [Rhizomicrobium sp.]|nr:ATP-binding protein [Rhizomicrobium sp.]
MSFRERLALFLIVALVTIQAITGLFAYVYLRQDLLARGKRDLSAAMGVFTRQIDFLSERVADGVQVLSLDFALRSAIAQHNYATELSALRNHGNRIGATRMMIVGLDGRITADTGEGADGRFRYPALLYAASTGEKGTALASSHGEIYWIVVAPVRAPVPIAYIAAFIPINDALLEKMREISSAPRAIALMTKAPGGHWMVASESALHRQHIELPSENYVAPSSAVVTERGQEFLAFTAPLKTAAGSAPVAAMLDYPLDDALGAYRGVIAPMIVVLLIGLLAMLAGTALIVRGLSRPLETLASAARRIATGDYTPPPKMKRNDEVGALADALVTMTASVAERERALREAVTATEKAKDEAVRANQAKSQFLSNMSHELRTPLNAIVGFSEMIGEEILGPVGVRRYADYARDIYGAGQHLLTLVERMLNLAEADANRLVIEHKRFAPGEEMRSVLAGLAGFAANSNVGILCEGLQTWPEITGEAAKLHQAFHNLVHNAIRFTPSGGTVTIRGAHSGESLAITIADTGTGMDPELAETVTRPFHRLRSAFDGKHQGAGLGLPFAKVVVELHGGKLAIASEPGKGTIVRIVLPLAEAKVRAA